MYPKFKTNLIGLAVALGFVAVGYGLGDAPRSAGPVELPMPVLAQAQAATDLSTHAVVPAPEVRSGALKRHLAMPYVSFAALLPRQES